MKNALRTGHSPPHRFPIVIKYFSEGAGALVGGAVSYMAWHTKRLYIKPMGIPLKDKTGWKKLLMFYIPKGSLRVVNWWEKKGGIEDCQTGSRNGRQKGGQNGSQNGQNQAMVSNEADINALVQDPVDNWRDLNNQLSNQSRLGAQDMRDLDMILTHAFEPFSLMPYTPYLMWIYPDENYDYLNEITGQITKELCKNPIIHSKP